jgi:hypothetical protein
LVARGRAGDPSIAYFEWGVPDDLPVPQADDHELLREWAEYHPAFGHFVSLDSFVALRKDIDDDDDFARAGGNRWTSIIGGGIDRDTWAGVRTELDIPADAAVGYGAARAADGTHVVVAAAAELDGVVVVEVVDVMPSYRAGVRVRQLVDGEQLAIPLNGPSSVLVDELDELVDDDRQLIKMSTRDESAACASITDSFDSRGIRFRQHPALDAAADAAALRSVGDGGKVWARSSSAAPIAALEAATNAVHALGHRAVLTGSPVVAFG